MDKNKIIHNEYIQLNLSSIKKSKEFLSDILVINNINPNSLDFYTNNIDENKDNNQYGDNYRTSYKMWNIVQIKQVTRKIKEEQTS